MLAASTVLLAALTLLGLAECRARDRAHAVIPIRIHVNGTRGKSTTVRLVAGALREAGIVTLAKTTGTVPRLILPDGSEQDIRRRAPASIREQLWFLREARRRGAGAIVVECMAVDPDLQAVSERDMIRATIGVITNVRLDHGEVMGVTIDEVGASLASTVPGRGILVVGPGGGTGPIVRAAGQSGTRLVQARTDEAATGDGVEPWMADNVATALAVTRAVGLADAVALRGMRGAASDPGAVARGTIAVGDRHAAYLDATAANDSSSLSRILEQHGHDAVFVYHHRADRPYRLRQFSEGPPWPADARAIILTGDRPDWTTWRQVRRSARPIRVVFRPGCRLAASLREAIVGAPALPTIVFCGNTKGFARERLIAAVERG